MQIDDHMAQVDPLGSQTKICEGKFDNSVMITRSLHHIARGHEHAAHRKNDVTHGGVVLQVPVFASNLRGRLILPLIQLASVDVVQAVGVGLHRLLLQVAHKGMAMSGRQHVEQGV